jgi:glycerophosphoryl diester phosphodiesterase
MMTEDGLAIVLQGRATRLKWHRLRRSLQDAEFSAGVMAEGFRLGASMELDLRVRADGGFVVLHDNVLDRETSGVGPVVMHHAGDLADLKYRQSGLPLISSEDLAALMPLAHPAALLQFDMKDDLAVIGARGLDHLVDHFGYMRAPVIISGGCVHLMRAVAERLPQVLVGIDPTDRLVSLGEAQGIAAMAAALTGELRGGVAPDTCYLAWQLVLEAQAKGLDLIALCHAEGVKVDAWTYTLADPANGFSDQEWADFSALMALGPDQITTDAAVATEAAWAARTVSA